MGAIADLRSNGITISSGDPLDQYLDSYLKNHVDVVVSAAAAADSVHTIATSTQTSGNFTLTVTLRNGETFTTGNIAFNAAAATIESAIDSAATSASITGWTNGDISVSGGAVNVAPVVLTFDGSSVSGAAHPITVLNDVSGSGGDWGAITRTTAGQNARYGWGVLEALAVVSGSYPVQDAAESSSAFTQGANYEKIPQWVIRELARECAAEDDNPSSYFSIVTTLAGIDDRAPLHQSVSRDVS